MNGIASAAMDEAPGQREVSIEVLVESLRSSAWPFVKAFTTAAGWVRFVSSMAMTTG